MIVQSFAELQSVVAVGVNSCRAAVFALGAVVQAHPGRQSFHLHLLLELIAIPQSQVDATLVI